MQKGAGDEPTNCDVRRYREGVCTRAEIEQMGLAVPAGDEDIFMRLSEMGLDGRPDTYTVKYAVKNQVLDLFAPRKRRDAKCCEILPLGSISRDIPSFIRWTRA